MSAANTITGIIAGVAALLGVFASIQSTVNSAKIEENRIELEQQQQRAEYQLKVFERVADAIEKADTNPQQIRAAVSLVSTLPDDEDLKPGQVSLKQQLLIILVEGGLSAGGEAADAVEGIREQTSDAPEAAVTKDVVVQAPSEVVQQQPTMAARNRSLSPGSLAEISPRLQLPSAAMRMSATWNVDVFYCAGANSAANQTRAAAIHQTLVAAGEKQLGVSDVAMPLGRVRMRELTEDANRRPGYGVSRDEIRAESGESAEAAALAKLIAGEGAALPVATTRFTRTPYYLSVFACG
jgi:hypothetical protein